MVKENTRHPVVVVLGHVDHGKTTLLDFIRKTNVALGEAGGITQHLGAYEIVWHERKITFLDTPGHHTFAKMRERGAHVADIAVLTVAADDGVKPQTVEAFKAIQRAGIPFVVALNKIDKPTAEPDRVKAQLAEIGVLVEGWGGKVPVVPISAKAGTHVDELLDTILLLADLEALRADPTLPAEGVIIEAHLDSQRGPSAVLLITNGTLSKGDFVLAGSALAPVRILEGITGGDLKNAGPASPVRVVGFNEVPLVGSPFKTFKSKAEIEEQIAQAVLAPRRKEDTIAEIGILIKADVAGSLEALESEAAKIVPQGLLVKFFTGGVGGVTDGDIKNLSAAKKGILLTFRTKIRPTASDLAERFNISVGMFDIIYEALDWLKKTLEGLAPKKLMRTDLGELLILKTFRSTPAGRVVGGRVREGKVPKDAQFEVLRQGEIVTRGKVLNIERNKIQVEALREGEEGGLLVNSGKAIEERDILVFFYEREA